MAEGTIIALTEAALALHHAVRSHKRAEAQHRRQARELMRQFDQLRAVCERHNIQLDIHTDEGTSQWPKHSTSLRSSTATP